MSKYIRFPTGTRFGWLGFLALAIIFAALEDAFFPHIGVLGHIFGLLGMAAGLACILEVALPRVEESTVISKNAVILSKQHSWVWWAKVGLLILAAMALVYILGASL